MWKLTEPAKAVRATHALIREFNEMEAAPGDRPFSPHRFELHKKRLAGGTFRIPEWASILCKEDGKIYRLNGKHTARLFAEANGELPPAQQVFLSRYEADTKGDVAEAYSTFDTRISARTSGDINKVYQVSCESLIDIPNRVFSVAVGGIAYAEKEDAYCQLQPDVRAQNAINEPGFVIWLSGIIGSSREKDQMLRRTGVVAAMYRTWKKSQSASSSFWTSVRDETGEKPNLPDRTLARFLRSVSVCTGAGARTGKKAVSTREIYCKCIYAWNAWRRGDDMEGLKYLPSGKTPPIS